MMKLKIVFSNFANTPKNIPVSMGSRSNGKSERDSVLKPDRPENTGGLSIT